LFSQILRHPRWKVPVNTAQPYQVGYGRPPQHTRWKKGECGNPKRIRKRAAKPVVQMIDDFFAAEVDIVEQGTSRRVSNFEAILLQLTNQAIAGEKRPMKVLLQYQDFAARRAGGMGGTLYTR
jgi:hypothetical protein